MIELKSKLITVRKTNRFWIVLEMRSFPSTQKIIELLVFVMNKPLKGLDINYLKEHILSLIQRIPELFSESDEIFVFISNESLNNRHRFVV